MTQPQKATSQVADLSPLIEGVAKNFVVRIYGPDGPAWGTKLVDLEEMVTQIGQAVSQQILEQALARQASTPSTAMPPCPSCGTDVEPREPVPRQLQTGVGAAQWHEPHGYCNRCRRSFFPSVEEAGD